MKKIYFSIVGVMAITSLSAQITLTSATSTPNAGETKSVTTGNGMLNVTNAGANQVWDFSSTSGTTGAVDYKSLANSNDPSSFPNANLVEEFTNQGENYYNNSTSSLSIEGHYIPGLARIVYTDKREYLNFPMTYNSVYNETFSGVLEGLTQGILINRGGSHTITGDSYGDLILPYTTVNNVLRVKTVVDYTDIYNGAQIAQYNDTIYTWYNATNNTFLASYSVSTTDGVNSGYFWTVLNQADYVTSVNENLSATKNPLVIFPNPAVSNITLTNVKGIENISILNINGQTIKTISGISENQSVNIDEIPRGFYLIQYTSNNSVFTEKLVKN